LDQFLHAGKSRFGRGIAPRIRELWPRRDADTLRRRTWLRNAANWRQLGERLPDGFRDERHDGLHETQDRIENADQDTLSGGAAGGVFKPAFRHLDIPIAELRPGEFVDRPRDIAEAEAVEMLRDRGCRRRQSAQNPAVLNRQFLNLDRARSV